MKMFIFLLLTSMSVSAQVNLGTIEFSGKVQENGRGIPGVPVTDGYNVVVTDIEGKYKLTGNSMADFIYITIPSGYEIPYENNLPQFYEPVANKANKRQTIHFNLRKSLEEGHKHIAVVWADPQVYKEKDVALCQKAADDLKAFVAQTCSNVPIHGIVCGDIVGDAPELYTPLKEVIASSGVPFFYLPGNHDINLNVRSDELSRQRYKQNFGPDFYSFNRGKIHYVVLSDVFYTGRDYSYIGYISERQFNWLKQDLALTPTGSTVVVSLHIPTYSAEAYKKEFNKESTQNSLQNRNCLYDLLKPYRAHVFSGHMHSNSNWVLSDSLYEHNHAAICGIFWQGPDCADGTPPGYGVYEANGNQFTWKYKAIGNPIDHQFRVYPVGYNPEKPDVVTAIVWNYDPSWKIYWYENGIRKGEMIQYTGHDPQTANYIRKNKSHFDYDWIGTQATDHLFMTGAVSPGAIVEIEVIDRFGNVYTIKSRL